MWGSAMIESNARLALSILIDNLAGGFMSDLSKIAPWIAGIFAAAVGFKAGWHIEIKDNCIGICHPSVTRASAIRTTTVVAKDNRHHVELQPDGRYIGKDRKTGEQISLRPNPDGKSWSNRSHLYELIAETRDSITIRVTFPDGRQALKVLSIQKI
jgi:hypothetical protein